MLDFIRCKLGEFFKSALNLVYQVTALFRPFLVHDPPARFGTRLRVGIKQSLTSALTDGAVGLSPDFGIHPNRDDQGRIDFLLAHKKWGIELTGEGSRLDGGHNL